MAPDLSRHPCFNAEARHRFARIHLPVAPGCNVQCNFCNRKYDCANESRPGVTNALLSPQQALHYLQRVLQKDPRISVVGIAGPGDPFATPQETLETLRLVHHHYPDKLLCVASNGLALAPYAGELATLGVSHVTLTVNAVDPAIGAEIYGWVRDGKRVLRGPAAATLLWQRQSEAIRALKRSGVTVKINTIIVPGVNDGHVADVAQQVAALGADISNCVPLYPVADTAFASIESPSAETVAAIRAEVAWHLPIMEHCTRCRADAVGLLGEPMRPEIEIALLQAAAGPLNPCEDRPCVAAATAEGVLVNLHLGEARQLAVFRPEGDGFALVETRPAPPSGAGTERWLALARTLHDCRALLVASAGEAPRAALAAQGIRVIMMEGLIEEGLSAVYQGVEIRAPLQRRHHCGTGCAGGGTGCG